MLSNFDLEHWTTLTLTCVIEDMKVT